MLPPPPNIVSVQNSLACGVLKVFGSDAQKETYLRRIAASEMKEERHHSAGGGKGKASSRDMCHADRSMLTKHRNNSEGVRHEHTSHPRRAQRSAKPCPSAASDLQRLLTH
ncbi:MAG: acyl-CoA dehydrogenase family protein [Betaproteobacteria bacterium]